MGQIPRSVPVLSRGDIVAASQNPYYVKTKLSAGVVGSIQISWHDTASAFAVTFWTSNYDNPPVPAHNAAGPDPEYWHDEAADLPIPSVSAGTAGSDMLHIGNNGAKWGLLKFVPAANCNLSILLHEKD